MLFKVFELVIKLIALIQILASPFLLSIILALVFCYNFPGDLGVCLSIFLLVSGFISGVVLAFRIEKKYGAVEFISRLYSTGINLTKKKSDD